jgi:hypothetical protein
MSHKDDVKDEDEVMLAKLRVLNRADTRSRPTKPNQQKRRRGPFVMMDIHGSVAALRAIRSPQAMVWLYLHYRTWADAQPTVPLPNQTLVKLGVSRLVKHRALQRLEQAGFIQVDRRRRKTPLVTLLNKG